MRKALPMFMAAAVAGIVGQAGPVKKILASGKCWESSYDPNRPKPQKKTRRRPRQKPRTQTAILPQKQIGARKFFRKAGA